MHGHGGPRRRRDRMRGHKAPAVSQPDRGAFRSDVLQLQPASGVYLPASPVVDGVVVLTATCNIDGGALPIVPPATICPWRIWAGLVHDEPMEAAAGASPRTATTIQFSSPAAGDTPTD